MPNGRPAGGMPRRKRATYTAGSDPVWHAELITRTADIALAAMPVPLQVLDVGCGSGALLDEFVGRVPNAEAYVGVDPLPGALATARATVDVRVTLVRGAAESLPFAEASFDLVVATWSLQYWGDQRVGTEELARVLADNGTVVVVDTPDAAKMRSPKGIAGLLVDAGLRLDGVEPVQRSALLRRPMASAFIASR